MSFLDLDKGSSSLKPAVLFMIIAYAFSMAIRMIWVVQFGDYQDFYWQGQLMINTNDGYFFASGAQKILEEMHLSNPRVPDGMKYAVVSLTAALVQFTPFSLESVILYLPAVISSLVVIPIVLIGRLYNNVLLGFLAALIGSIAWSYYNRTMVGYYDTDMFSAMAPMFILYFLLRTIEKEDLNSALMAALTILVYPFLYDQGLSIVYAMGLLYMIYMVIFHRREDFTYHSIIMIAVALMGIAWFIKLPLILALYFAFGRFPVEQKKLMIGAAVVVFVFLYTGNVFSLIWGKFSTYFFRGVSAEGLKFFQVAQTVREAGIIPFETMANRISGSTVGVIAALIGYVLLVIRNRAFILALPLIGIGVFSLWGGLRFTVYAVPVAAISAVYLFFVLAEYIKVPAVKYGSIVLMTAAMLYPNITHIINYKVPTVLNSKEVAVLDRLKQTGTGKDYVVTWWDYGYPIWFYSNMNTLIDGGKHNHDNFIVSEILTTTSQLEAARLSRIAVETYISSGYKVVADTLFRNRQEDQVNVSEYLEQLRYGEVDLPEKTVDAYLFLPLRMLGIYPTLSLFSNIDLDTGKQGDSKFFYQTGYIRDLGEMVDLGNGVMMNKATSAIRLQNRETPLERMVVTEYGADGKLQVNEQMLNPSANLVAVFMRSYNKMLIIDKAIFNSTYIQMFVLDRYDPELFEPFELTPLVKVYKVKI